MIFVTVGTHEQPFNRLVEYIDGMKRNGLIKENVIIQTGYSTYEPEYCVWQKLYPYQKVTEFISQARIVITHGGPSSFIVPLQMGKIPIVVPRQKKFNEHINDHQMEFVRSVSERMKNIIPVFDIKQMRNIIENYGFLENSMKSRIQKNNAVFCSKFEEIVKELLEASN